MKYEILKEATEEELSGRGQDGWRVVQVMFRNVATEESR